MKQFATWNPLDKGTGVILSNLNLSYAAPANYLQSGVRATIGKSSGKWYWEVLVTDSSYLEIGVSKSITELLDAGTPAGQAYLYYGTEGRTFAASTRDKTWATWTTGDTIGIALDMDAGSVSWYKNNVLQGSYTGLTGTWYPCLANAWTTVSSATANFGATAFAYTPPSGFVGLSSEVGSVAATHWRVKATEQSWSAPTYGGYCFQATEVQLYESVNGTGTNVALTSTVSASSTWSGYPASRLIDGTVSYGSNWCTANGATELGWVQFILPEAKTIRSLNVAFSAAAEGNAPKSYDLQYSLDGGATWVTAASKQVTSAVRVADVYVSSLTNVPQLVADSASSRYWRMRATGPSWSTAYGGYLTEVSDFALYESTNQTGANLATGATASASSVYDANYPASYAIDGVVNSDAQVWVSGSGLTSAPWLQVTLPVAKMVRSAKITWLSQAGYGYLPKTFDLQYSPDEGTTWLTVVSDSTPASSTTATYYVSDFFDLSSTPVQPVSVGAATGGEVTTYEGWTIHSFKTNGAFVVPPEAALIANVLVIGGGASGGGGYYSGGGGAGGLLEQTSRLIGPGTYNIVIGIGGAAVSGNMTDGLSGTNTVFDTITALGGGYGRGYRNSGSVPGGDGGSGGGAGANAGSVGGSGLQTDSGGAEGYGFHGGASSNWGGGAGGGAGGAGADAISVDQQTPYGPGRTNAITGSLIEYARGGRGAGSNGTVATALANTGQGGDAAIEGGGMSGAGADGIVIIAYPTPAQSSTVPDAPTAVVASSPTVSTMSVAFTAPVNNGGSEVILYTVTSSPEEKTAAGAASPLTVIGLTQGVSYTFTATATNAIGTSVESEASAPLSTINVPNAPVIGTATLTDLNQATVTFSESTDNGAAITGYTAMSSVGGLTVTGTTSPLVLNGLEFGTAYQFSVVANSAVGSSLASANSNIVTTIAKTCATWDTVKHGANISLLNNNLTALRTTSGSWNPALSSLVMDSGKHYWEITGIAKPSGNAPIIGIAPAESTTSSSALNAFGFNNANPNGLIGLIAALSTTVYGFALDLVNGALYISQDGVWLNGGVPTSGAAKTGSNTLGNTISEGLKFRIVANLYGTNDSVTINAGSSAFAYTPPAGYTAGIYTLAIPQAAPANVVATAISATQISVAFAAGADNGAANPTTGYTVTAMPGNITASGTASPIVVSGLSASTEYTFSVKATNIDGTSVASTSSSAVSTWTVPDAPTAVTATRISGHRVSLAYAAPSNNGGSAITGYIATATPGGLTAQVVSGAIVLTGLEEEVDYTFSVQAINAIGTGVASAPSDIYTLPKLPDAPTNVVALAVGAKTHRITFNETVNNGGSPITSYTVRSNVGNFIASGSSSPILITDLTNSTTFSYTVEANTALGTSDKSANSNSLTVQPATGANTAVFATWDPAKKGSNLTLSNGNLTAASPSAWDGVRSTVGVSSGKHYWELKVSGGWSNVMAGIGNITQASTSYASNADGCEWYINNNALYPSGSAYGGSGPGSGDTVGVMLDLDAKTLAFSVNGVSRGVAKSSLPAGTWYAMVNPLSANSVTANFGATAFSYSVPSGYRAGLYSGNIAVNAPAAPTSVLAYEPGVTTAKVSFVTPSDNGGAAITGYMAVSTPDSLVFTSATSPIQITGLKEKTGYTFTVAAINSVGIGTMSAPTVQLATAAAPDAPTDLVVTDVSGHSANVECTAPVYDGGLQITGYRVTASPGGVTADGATTKVFISGLDVDTDYTFTMQAINSIGAGVESQASELVHTDDRIVTTQLGTHSFQLVVPAGSIAAEVLHDLRAVIADYGWDVHDSAYNVFRCLNQDGVTYKYLRLAVVGTTDSYATTEVYESWNGTTHVGLNRAGPNLSGQTVDDYSKTAFRLTSPTQINTVNVYCSNRWLAFGSYTDVNGVLGYNQTITAPNATRSAARESANTPKPTYDVSINKYAGVSGCFEFSREGLAVHGDVPCFFWTHTAWSVDDQLVLDTTNNKQAQHDAFYSTFEPRAQISHGILPSTIDQAGTKYTQVPITFTTAFVDQTDGRFLREPNAAFPPNVFNGMNQVIDLPCKSQYGFLGVVYGLKLCHPDNTLPAIFASKDFTCDSNFNIVKAGYGDLTKHWPIVTQIVKSVSQYDRTGVYHSDPVYGNLCQYTSTYYNCQGYYYGYFVYAPGNVYGIVNYDNYYTFTWSLTTNQTFDFRARFYIPA